MQEVGSHHAPGRAPVPYGRRSCPPDKAALLAGRSRDSLRLHERGRLVPVAVEERGRRRLLYRVEDVAAAWGRSRG